MAVIASLYTSTCGSIFVCIACRQEEPNQAAGCLNKFCILLERELLFRGCRLFLESYRELPEGYLKVTCKVSNFWLHLIGNFIECLVECFIECIRILTNTD